MAGDGRRLRFAALVLIPLGFILLVGATGTAMAGYTTVTVVGGSMEPTFVPGEHLVLRRINAGQVRRGDVVLYRTPDRYRGKAVLQRVIGLGGDHVAEQPSAQVTVNGKPLAEPYLMDGDPAGGPGYDVTVPVGRLFLLGDHRADSWDSRYFLSSHSGTIAATDVLARVTEDHTGFLGLGLAALLGLLLAVAGFASGITARIARRKTLSAPASLTLP